MKTLSVIFGRDLSQFAMIQEREAQAVQMVLDYLRGPKPCDEALDSVAA